MPYRMTWEPNPQNMHLKVHDALPPNAVEGHHSAFRGARLTEGGECHYFHYCQHCEGWIEGRPQLQTINTLGALSGRRGTAYYCLRCGESIGFNGVVS